MRFLDNLPVASIVFIIGTILVVVGYISDDLTVEQALETIGYIGVGSGVVGIARNGSGRGVK